MSRNIIAILRGVQPDEVLDIAAAVLDAGIERIEVPLNSPDVYESIARLAATFGEQAEIGAGTVLLAEQVDAVAEAGGRFVVSPDCNAAVIRRTLELGLGSYPGVLTPSEAFAAWRLGVDAIKLFPASLLGLAGFRAMKAVLPPELPAYAVGGVGADDFAAWRAAGVSGFGIGSELYQAGLGAEEVGTRAAQIVAAWDRLDP